MSSSGLSPKLLASQIPFTRRAGIAFEVGRNIILGKGSSRLNIQGVDTSDSWMSVLQPLEPFLPIVDGWQWNRPVGWNIFYQRRGRDAGRFDFDQLRALAQQSELVRLAIETRKDQLCMQHWQIKPKDETQEGDGDPRIKKITEFFECPDRRNDWDTWLRILAEELFVIDAMTIYKVKTRGGELAALELVDGSTIFPLLTEDARSPLPPNPAYQQVLFGVPKADYTRDQLLYAPRNLRVYTPFGFSNVEQIAAYAAQTDAQRSAYQLAYFTEGSTPDSYAVVDDEKMAPEQIEAFQSKLNDFMRGNPGNRRQIPFFPKGTKVDVLKQPPLKDDFDEWLARKICFAFSIAPNAFIKQMNRSTGESEHDRGLEEGLEPVKKTIANLINRVIRDDFKAPDLEFAWLEDNEVDAETQDTIIVNDTKSAIITINEARAMKGLKRVEGGDQPLVYTAAGYVPLTAYEDKMAQQDVMNQNMADQTDNPDGTQPPAKGGKAPPAKAKGVTDNTASGDDDHSNHGKAYGRVGKAVSSPLAITFRPDADNGKRK